MSTNKRTAPVNGLRKTLKEHHIGMIALSATLGRGLTIDSGRILSLAGPGGGVLAYLLMGGLAWCVVATLGEIVSLLPVSGPFSEIPSRFIDEAAGFTSGWMYTFTYIITFPSQLSAASQIFAYRYNEPNGHVQTMGKASTITPALWTSLFFVVAVLLNLLPVERYGRIEYFFGAFKLVGLSLIMLMSVCLNQYKGDSLPGVDVPRPIQDYCKFSIPQKIYQDRWADSSFTVWSKCQAHEPSCKTPGAWGFMPSAFTADNGATFTGTKANLMAFWSALTLAFFAYIGVDMIAVTAAETAKPHRHIKIATRKIMIRSTILYFLGFLLAGFNVPYDHNKLLTKYTQEVPVTNFLPDSLGARSPFLIAAVEAGYKKLPIALNLFYAFAAWSAGTTSLYASSRTLYSMAEKGRIPWSYLNRKLTETGVGGVPRNAVYVSSLFGFLAYITTSNDKAATAVLSRFSTAATICALIVYAIVCFAGLRYFKGLKYTVPRIYRSEVKFNARSQADLNDDEVYDYPWQTKGQPLLAFLGLVLCVLLVVFNGWYEFQLRRPEQRAGYILACYLPVILAVLIYLGRKFFTREKGEGWFVSPMNMNFEGRVSKEGSTKQKGALEKIWDKYIA